VTATPPAPASIYAERLAAEVQRLIDGPAGPRAVHVLMPAGAESVAGVAAFLGRVAEGRTLLDCRRVPVSNLLDRIDRVSPGTLALLYPEALPPERLRGALQAASRRGALLSIGERPFWLQAGGVRADLHYLLDFRAFQYTDAELLALLRAGPLAAFAQAEDARAPSLHGLRRLTQAWPGITEAALEDIAASVAGGSERSGDEVEAIARLPACRRVFAQAWLPVLAAHYPWLRHACRLPLITLDLLSALLRDIGSGAQQCLTIGWLERVPGAAGAYRLESVLEQFLVSEPATAADHRFLEKAAAWYEAHGHVSEAIECLAAVGLAADRASALLGRGAMEPAARPVSAAAQAPRLSAEMLHGAGVASAARQALGARADIPAAAAARQPVTDLLPDVPALQHLLKAISYYQTQEDEDVSRSLDAAKRAGIQTRQISNLIDFVDLHLRPLVKPGSAAGPLAAVFGGLKHAGPARQSLRPASQPLNHRELQILELMCEGKGNKEIADRMGLELSTVKWYGTRIFEKLGVRSRTQAIAKARSQGLFD
jgi:DNA-binding CsgD family transcriptional regulator